MKIKRLAELTDQQRLQLEFFYHPSAPLNECKLQLLHPEKEFNEYNLRFPIEYLNKLGWYLILFPIETIAEYADGVTTAMVNDPSRAEELLLQFDNLEQIWITPQTLQSIKATGIGNVGYLALHCTDECLRNKAENFLSRVLDQALTLIKPILN
jgi:hypothetical protein